VSVLLLEAGGDGAAITEIPLLQGLMINSDIDWAYKTRRDKRICFGLEGGRCVFHRGKAIGGSSNINTMLYIRGRLPL
jgi:choline dehydrogenase